MIGPALGGLLANPVKLYPKTFSGNKILTKFPYLLPNAITSLFGVIAFILILLYLPETLPVNVVKTVPNNTEPDINNVATVVPGSKSNDCENLLSAAEATPHKTAQGGGASVVDLIYTPGVALSVTAYFALSFVSIIYDEIVPLWAMASSKKGGLNMEQIRIGQMASAVGFILLVYTLIGYPYCADKLGSKKGYRFGMILASPFILVTTLINQLDNKSKLKLPLTTLIVSFSKICTSLSFSSISLLLNELVAADKRASLNGFAMAMGSLSKFFGPCFGSIALAWSLNNGLHFPLDSHFTFLIISVISLGSAFIPLNSFSSSHSNMDTPSPAVELIKKNDAKEKNNNNTTSFNILSHMQKLPTSSFSTVKYSYLSKNDDISYSNHESCNNSDVNYESANLNLIVLEKNESKESDDSA